MLHEETQARRKAEKRAEQERQRAEQERQRAERAETRVEALVEQLRAMGIDPNEVTQGGI